MMEVATASQAAARKMQRGLTERSKVMSSMTLRGPRGGPMALQLLDTRKLLAQPGPHLQSQTAQRKIMS